MENLKNMLVYLNGEMVLFEDCVALMDDELREEIANDPDAWCDEQDFLESYCALHYTVYGDEFVI